MPCRGPNRERLPIILGPAEMMHEGRYGEGRVRRAPRHHHLRACGQRFGQGRGADIGIGGNKLPGRHIKPGIGFMHGHAIQIDAGGNIITSDKPDAEFRQTQTLCKPCNGARRRQRIGRAKIAKDGNARARRIGEYRLQQAFQHGLITRFRVSAAFQLRERHRTFAQTFKEHGCG